MFKLSRRSILRKNRSFQTVYRFGKSFANRQLVLYILPSRGQEGKVGFAAGKKLGNAVTRNRIKRLMREAYRHNQLRIKQGYDLIIVGRQSLLGEKMPVVSAALLKLCSRAGILMEQ